MKLVTSEKIVATGATARLTQAQSFKKIHVPKESWNLEEH